MQRRRLMLFPIAVLLVAACSSAGGSLGGSSAKPAPPAAGSVAPTRIEVSLTDQLKIEPTSMIAPSGLPVTFVVTNAGAIDHEFVLGDDSAQAEHEQEMLAGGMQHDEPDGIFVKPGETKELTFTFATPGETLAGCHVTGHYGAGMKATITITE